MISKVYKNPSTRTLSSNDTRKARIEIMVHSKTLFQGSNIIKNDLGRLSFLDNEDWSLFIEEKSQTSRLGFDRSS